MRVSWRVWAAPKKVWWEVGWGLWGLESTEGRGYQVQMGIRGQWGAWFNKGMLESRSLG